MHQEDLNEELVDLSAELSRFGFVTKSWNVNAVT
jgi:hypothetical protein